MKKIIFVLLLCVFFISGCGINYPPLKDDAIVFEFGDFIDHDDDDNGYGTLIYQGRTYIDYGYVKKSLKESDIIDCLGYIKIDENIQRLTGSQETDTRVYTIAEDANTNFLMVYYVGNSSTEMTEPTFYRAMDTRGIDIKLPSFMDSYNYKYWE